MGRRKPFRALPKMGNKIFRSHKICLKKRLTMISIIICSKNPLLLDKVSQSIAATIGIEHEIITINNPNAEIGICEAYNKGALQAKYPYLCFSHEDIIFHTQNWGQKVVNHLLNPTVGLIGVVGCIVKPRAPSGVWLNSHYVNRVHMVQGSLSGETYIKYDNPLAEVKAEVKVVDGLFMSCRKQVWEENMFDELNFTDFHAYDIDFSLQIAQKYKLYIVYDIEMEHLSNGGCSHSWVTSILKLDKKWMYQLPLYTHNFNLNQLKKLEYKTLDYFLCAIISNKMVNLEAVSYFLQMVKISPFKLNNLRIIKFYFKSLFYGN
jgi:glycosyltransferase involved in cell wall biosynthesis